HTSLTLAHFYDKLVTLGPGLQPQPSLATSWENPSEKVWRFHLREDVYFHDGRRMDAEDVAVSLDRARAKGSEIAHYLQAIDRVSAENRDVVIVTKEPSSVLLYDLVFASIVPKDAPAVIDHPIGTGPYEFVSGKPGETIEGRAFAKSWRPRPAFD